MLYNEVVKNIFVSRKHVLFIKLYEHQLSTYFLTYVASNYSLTLRIHAILCFHSCTQTITSQHDCKCWHVCTLLAIFYVASYNVCRKKVWPHETNVHVRAYR